MIPYYEPYNSFGQPFNNLLVSDNQFFEQPFDNSFQPYYVIEENSIMNCPYWWCLNNQAAWEIDPLGNFAYMNSNTQDLWNKLSKDGKKKVSNKFPNFFGYMSNDLILDYSYLYPNNIFSNTNFINWRALILYALSLIDDKQSLFLDPTNKKKQLAKIIFDLNFHTNKTLTADNIAKIKEIFEQKKKRKNIGGDITISDDDIKKTHLSMYNYFSSNPSTDFEKMIIAACKSKYAKRKKYNK
jgi:hypothetical protein